MGHCIKYSPISSQLLVDVSVDTISEQVGQGSIVNSAFQVQQNIFYRIKVCIFTQP